MKYQELIDNINSNNIPSDWFSINQGLKPNAFILYKNYDKWEYFYLDEKGNRLDSRIFFEEDLCFDFFWQKLLLEKSYPPSTPPTSVGI